ARQRHGAARKEGQRDARGAQAEDDGALGALAATQERHGNAVHRYPARAEGDGGEHDENSNGDDDGGFARCAERASDCGHAVLRRRKTRSRIPPATAVMAPTGTSVGNTTNRVTTSAIVA